MMFYRNAVLHVCIHTSTTVPARSDIPVNYSAILVLNIVQLLQWVDPVSLIHPGFYMGNKPGLTNRIVCVPYLEHSLREQLHADVGFATLQLLSLEILTVLRPPQPKRRLHQPIPTQPPPGLLQPSLRRCRHRRNSSTQTGRSRPVSLSRDHFRNPLRLRAHRSLQCAASECGRGRFVRHLHVCV